MTQPGKNFLRRKGLSPLGDGRAVYHQHRQAERPGGRQLGFGAFAAGVLADHEIDGVVLQKGAVCLCREGAAVHHQSVAGKRRRLLWLVDEAQEIMVLGLGGEGFHMHAPKCQHDAAGLAGNCLHRQIDAGNRRPAIAVDGAPGRTGQGDVIHARRLRRDDGMGAHGGREGMRGIDKMSDMVRPEVIGETGVAAEAADPDRYGMSVRVARPAGVAERCRDAFLREETRQLARFGGPTQQEDVRHG